MVQGLQIPDFTSQELFSAYHDALRRAVGFGQQYIIPILNGQLVLKQREEAVLGLFYITHSLASSGTRLNHKLDFMALAGTARTLFELLLDVKILADPNVSQVAVDQFRTFAEVDRFKKARQLVEIQTTQPELEDESVFDSRSRKVFVEAAGKAGDIENKVSTLWGCDKKGKLRWPAHWSGLSIRDRAKKFGVTSEQEYLEIYTFLCAYAHSGNSSYAYLSDAVLESVYGFALRLTGKMYLDVLQIVADLFHIQKGMDCFPQILSHLKEAEVHILTQYSLDRLKDTKDAI